MLATAEEAAEPNVRGRLTVACSAALTLENTHCIAKAAMARTATSSNCCGTAETAPESALLQKRPRDSHARVMTTHDSERRPNGRARSTTSPLHTRSRWCGRMALKPACPCVTLDHLRRAVVRSGKQAAAARLNSRCGRHNSILNDS